MRKCTLKIQKERHLSEKAARKGGGMDGTAITRESLEVTVREKKIQPVVNLVHS